MALRLRRALALAQPSSKPGAYTELRWDDLVPKGWDPMAGFKDKNIGALVDGDPKTMDMMSKLREAWDNAPAETRLDGAAIKLPGYLVPRLVREVAGAPAKLPL